MKLHQGADGVFGIEGFITELVAPVGIFDTGQQHPRVATEVAKIQLQLGIEMEIRGLAGTKGLAQTITL
ncbi:hypothetical protein [Marinobacter sp. VGCF2001]|uniref:hypothetical protein n=1 Tax=Marinobacter sp. VGCF2001 TaxID=3417189 RepID=UPI003CEA6376